MPQKASFSTVYKLTPSNLTLKFWKEVSENFNDPLKLPPNWTTQNDLEFVVKFRQTYMGFPFICKEKKQISLKKTTLFYCGVTGTNPNGTLIGLSIGNSFSMNAISTISTDPRFKKVINVFGNGASFPAHDELEKYLIENLVKKIKPDVILLVQRYFQKYLYNTSIEKIPEHSEFKYWNKILEIISNYTSAIIINKEQIVFPYDISQDYIRKKFYGLPIESRIKKPVS
uniref:Uncharacterized protein n=1 Tax=Panagrolaimus davidi TaxID=227884 RepID=A0A914PPF9_9BILA